MTDSSHNNNQWTVELKGLATGPFTTAKVEELLRQRQITLETRITRAELGGTWISVGEMLNSIKQLPAGLPPRPAIVSTTSNSVITSGPHKLHSSSLASGSGDREDLTIAHDLLDILASAKPKTPAGKPVFNTSITPAPLPIESNFSLSFKLGVAAVALALLGAGVWKHFSTVQGQPQVATKTETITKTINEAPPLQTAQAAPEPAKAPPAPAPAMAALPAPKRLSPLASKGAPPATVAATPPAQSDAEKEREQQREKDERERDRLLAGEPEPANNDPNANPANTTQDMERSAEGQQREPASEQNAVQAQPANGEPGTPPPASQPDGAALPNATP